MMRCDLRPATRDDIEAIADVWHSGWPDGHLGNVPDRLVERRRNRDDFVRLASSRIATTTVAVSQSVVGFVTIHEDEVEQVYVAADARGSGVGAALLGHAEAVIGERFGVAWLAVVAGNTRARRFYAKQGWRDAGPIEYYAEVHDGRIAVPCHRYEKQLITSRQ